ncbi:iron uptake porin [Pseudanabaena sp. PCC 6802]|uniref:iron uptake porin n=1 Tax=Pseudanabaena sp. PCC 6802 TaxID=118173 RepID=UPI000345A1F8|nr:iron uptake porin [Pseudanabaena sp. PCC 6802]
MNKAQLVISGFLWLAVCTPAACWAEGVELDVQPDLQLDSQIVRTTPGDRSEPTTNQIEQNTPPNTASNIPPNTANQPALSQNLAAPSSLVQEIQQVNRGIESTQAQVTSVSQLSDVKPTDWAFTALQSLVERYGCIAGYPDRTYRGQRAMTRYEFAAGLNACLDKINEIITAGLADKVSKEDLAALRKLQEEFAAELAALKGRVDALESKTAEIESQQFSTTVKLGGEVIFGLAGATGASPGFSNPNIVFTSLARLGLTASFTGDDRLRVGLQAANFGSKGNPRDQSGLGFASGQALGTYMALLSYQSTTNNNFELEMLEYRFPAFGDRVVFTFRPVGFSLSTVLTANSPYFDNGRGSISRFGEASPLFKIGNLQAGAGFDWLLGDRVRLQVAYGTANSGNSTAIDPVTNRTISGGITGSDSSALGVQFLLKPADNVWTGIAYINGYSANGRLNTATGSVAADTSGVRGSATNPNGLDFTNAINQPSTINAISGTLNWAISPTVRLGAWGGWTFTNSQTSSAYANTTTWLLSLGFSDPFGREGDLLAFLFGQPPKLTQGRSPTGLNIADTATGLHYEVFYRYQVNKNISITPGFFFVTNPDHAAGANTILVGTIRTVFRF